MIATMQRPLVRVDDASALIDLGLAYSLLAAAMLAVIAGLAYPRLHVSMLGSVVVALVALGRLAFHPLRLAGLHRVYVDDAGQVHLATAFGRARPVALLSIEHVTHAAWPCALRLAGGERARFVARRDDGVPAFLVLELSDRARYEGERTARDSLVDLEVRAHTALARRAEAGSASS
jgi:hypothetical protein